MRTNVVIDDALMMRAKLASGLKTERKTIETALRLLIDVRGQREVLKLRGRLQWRGDLKKMRKD